MSEVLKKINLKTLFLPFLSLAICVLRFHPFILIFLFIPVSIYGIYNIFFKKIDCFKCFSFFLVICATCYAWENFKFPLDEGLYFLLRPKAFELCKKHVVVDGDAQIAVCSYEDRFWRAGFSRAIVYDASGEIELTPKDQSDKWKTVAYSFQKQVPFGIEGYVATQISHHFYWVDFQETFSPKSNENY